MRQNPSPLSMGGGGGSRGGTVANYYVAMASKYPPSAHPQPMMARDGSFRLSRFGRKVLAVARLKKVVIIIKLILNNQQEWEVAVQ